MDPIDFFRTAELLKGEVGEAHLRTSVGRSYYAAFLYFREYLKKIGLEKTKQPGREAHTFVIQCMANSNVPEGGRASQYLQDLRRLREDADYHLDRVFSQNDAEDAFVKAQKIVSDYKTNISPEKEQILVNKASAYAKQKGWI